MLRDSAIALSLANLCLLRVWGRVALYSDADAFYMIRPPGTAPILAAALNLAVLSALFWSLLRLSRSGRIWIAPTARFLLVGAVLAALNSTRSILFGRFPALKSAIVTSLGGATHTAGILGALILAVGLCFVLQTRLRRFGGTALLILAPLAPITMVGAAGRLMHLRRGEAAEPPLSRRTSPAGSRSRVVWVIFDEWGYGPAFDKRPAGLRTPHLDRLAAESLFATEAYPPANDTVPSIPSLLAGARIAAAREAGPAELLIRREGDRAAVRWEAGMTVLARAKEHGVNTAVAGWHLPYCRILAPVVSACHWCELSRSDEGDAIAGRPIGQVMAAQLRGLVETAQFSLLGWPQGPAGHARTYIELLQAGQRFASDPEIGFVFLHLPIPHAPYLRRTEEGTLSRGDYSTSLVLVDEAAGRLIEAMESRGVWESTHLLLSSDHALRSMSAEDARVPFILRLATDRRGQRYGNRFSSEVTTGLLLDVLRGEITDYGAAARRLDSGQ